MALKFIYTNWKGVTSKRRVDPVGFWEGSTEWHPEKQFFLRGFDLDKQELRDFAIKDIKGFIRLEEKKTADKKD